MIGTRYTDCVARISAQRSALTWQRLLQTEGRYCRYGLIPNAFPDAGADPSTTVSTTLWWIETLGLYLEATQDWNFLAEQYRGPANTKTFTTGTKYNIRLMSLMGWSAGMPQCGTNGWMQ